MFLFSEGHRQGNYYVNNDSDDDNDDNEDGDDDDDESSSSIVERKLVCDAWPKASRIIRRAFEVDFSERYQEK